MYIVNLNYIKPIEEVEKYLGEHRDFLDKYLNLGNLILAGRKNPRTGGLFILSCDNEEEMNKIVKEDPFYLNKVADYDITEIIPTKLQEGLEKIIK